MHFMCHLVQGTKVPRTEVLAVVRLVIQHDDIHLAPKPPNRWYAECAESFGYDTISDTTILQCIAAHINKQVRAKDILKLERRAVIESWPVVKQAIFTAVDYLRTIELSNRSPFCA